MKAYKIIKKEFGTDITSIVKLVSGNDGCWHIFDEFGIDITKSCRFVEVKNN